MNGVLQGSSVYITAPDICYQSDESTSPELKVGTGVISSENYVNHTSGVNIAEARMYTYAELKYMGLSEHVCNWN